MFILRTIIFEFFGLQAKVDDINKDVDNRGFNQRFQELLAGDLDDNELALVNNFLTNLVNPTTLLEQYIIYREYMVGAELPVSNDAYFRRKILPLYFRLYDIKGSIPAYVQFFRMIGFDTVDIVESISSNGLDHPDLTLDSDERRLDSTGAVAGYYEVHLTGSMTITENLKQFIYNVIEINEPINAELRRITYNGTDVEVIQPADRGDFNYDFNLDFFV